MVTEIISTASLPCTRIVSRIAQFTATIFHSSQTPKNPMLMHIFEPFHIESEMLVGDNKRKGLRKQTLQKRVLSFARCQRCVWAELAVVGSQFSGSTQEGAVVSHCTDPQDCSVGVGVTFSESVSYPGPAYSWQNCF